MSSADWLWVWIGTAVAFAALELVLPVLFFAISFALGAAAGALAALADAGLGLQWGAFLLGSGLALAVLVPIGRRISHAEAEGDDAAEGSTRWIGRVALVLEEIPGGPHSTGLVRLERAQWRAEAADESPIPPGTQVEVLSVRGTRLVVAPVQPPR